MSGNATTGLVPETITRAVTALLKHHKVTQGNQLLEDSCDISLIFGLRKIPQRDPTKPIGIPLDHTLHPRGAEVCLITKDPQKDFKQLLTERGVDSVTKVIGLSKLRKNYKSFEQKRNLCNQFDVFLADARILNFLPSVLGKKFFEKKKQPIPVNLTKRNLKVELTKAIDSTQLFLGHGACCAVRVGRSHFSVPELVDNIMKASSAVISHIPKQWKNVQSINIKTPSSIALPIFNSIAEETLPHVAGLGGAHASEPVSPKSPAPPTASAEKKKQKKSAKAAATDGAKTQAKPLTLMGAGGGRGLGGRRATPPVGAGGGAGPVKNKRSGRKGSGGLSASR